MIKVIKNSTFQRWIKQGRATIRGMNRAFMLPVYRVEDFPGKDRHLYAVKTSGKHTYFFGLPGEGE